MKPSNELFDLIQSLTKSEKRFFKLHSALQSGEKNYLRIFDAVDKQKAYDEEAIKKQFAKETFIRHFPSEKNHLYKLVLKALRAYHAESSVTGVLKQHINNIEILFSKALYAEATKILHRAKKVAADHERFYYWFELLSWEKMLIEEAYQSGNFTSDLDALIKEEGKVLLKLQNLAVYNVLYAKVNYVFRSGGYVRTDEEHAIVEEISDQWLPFARVNCLMPHQEWLSEGSRALLSRLDVVLSKTHFAERLFAELGLRSIYTGFTTLDRYNPGIRKDFGACIHVAGSSLQKGSMAVNRTWLDNPSFPTLEMYWYEPSARPIGASNIRLERGFLRERVIHEAQNHCGIHLCPSEAEGYGHYLAEAMSCGALVVSTDAPPMNELVTNERGVLVGYDRVAPQAVGTNFYVDEQKFADGMRGIFAMRIEERKRLGEAARSWFVENDRAFRNRFWEVLQGLA